MRLHTVVNALWFACFCVPFAGAQTVLTRVPLSETREVVPAFSASGEITLPAAHLQLEFAYANGRKERRELLVVHDAREGHYLWDLEIFPSPSKLGRFATSLKNRHSMIYAGAAGIFEILPGERLHVRAYKDRADNLAAAVGAAIGEIQHGLPKLAPGVPATSGWPWEYEAIELALDTEFTCLAMTSYCPDRVPTTITSFGTEANNNLRIVMHNRFDVEVIVDQSLNLVSTRRLTEPKPDGRRNLLFERETH